MPFMPGLVGGHCIGVDPYYLTTLAEQVGYYPQVILAGRRINDSMGVHIANKLVNLLTKADKVLNEVRVGILGLSFKENVSDLRNSRVPDIITKLAEFGIKPLVHDPFANAEEAFRQYGIQLLELDMMRALDGLIMAVPHEPYLKMQSKELCAFLVSDCVLIDVKSALNPADLPAGITYWSL
jgi:UDP-N-acetyl-D-galactosamine dehydrogenase